MGAVDVERQALNVFRMRLLGAEVEAVHSGSKTLKDAVNEAMRRLGRHGRRFALLPGSVMGPHLYPGMVRQFHRVIGDEAAHAAATGADPDVVACVGGGLERDRHLLRLRRHRRRPPGGRGRTRRGSGGAPRGARRRPRHAQLPHADEYGQVEEALSISAGLDYPGVGPEHSWLSSIGRAEYPNVTDDEVVQAFQLLSRTEGIIPALESAHAIAWLSREAHTIQGQTVVVNLSGRGDKDVAQMMDVLGDRGEA
ncbi:MAG: hypothetical protein R2697_17285 [Ilumatobacteraceae bacterium]